MLIQIFSLQGTIGVNVHLINLIYNYYIDVTVINQKKITIVYLFNQKVYILDKFTKILKLKKRKYFMNLNILKKFKKN